MAAIRFWCAGIALFAFLRWRGVALPSAAQARNSSFMGVLLLGGGNGFVCYAQLSVSSGQVAVASMPLFAAMFGSLIGFTAYAYPLQTVRPALATSYAYVNPPIAIAIGALLAGERLTTHEMAAAAIILAGVAIILAARR